MNKKIIDRQMKVIERRLEGVRRQDFYAEPPTADDPLSYASKSYEFKRVCITFDHELGIAFLKTTVGFKGDEGTLASAFARDHRLVRIGPRGGLSACNGRSWIKGRLAPYVRYKH